MRGWKGQKQVWFAYRFTGTDEEVMLDLHQPPEFDAWRWASLDEAPELVIPFKRATYDHVVQAFADHAQGAEPGKTGRWLGNLLGR